jgi:hypothetical protein
MKENHPLALAVCSLVHLNLHRFPSVNIWIPQAMRQTGSFVNIFV